MSVTTMTHVGRLIPAMVVMAVAGCSAPPDGTLRWESEHFRYVSQSPPVFTEAQQIAAFEAHAALLTEALGVELEPGARIEFRVIDDVEDIRAWSGGYAAFYVSDRDLILTPSEFHGHELVHAYAARAAVGVPSFLTEGLAEVLSCVPQAGADVEPDRDVVTWLTGAATGARDDPDPYEGSRRYQVSASFVGFVIARHGLDAFMSAYRVLGGRTDVDAVFRAELGEGLSTLVDAWVAEGPRNAAADCLWIVECAGPVEDAALPIELAFAQRHYLTGVPPLPGGAEEIRVLDLPAGNQRWHTMSTARAAVSWVPCDGGLPVRGVLVEPGEQHATLTLPPGRTAVIVESELASPTRIEIEARPVDPPVLAAVCEAPGTILDARQLTSPRVEVIRLEEATARCTTTCDLWLTVQTDGPTSLTPRFFDYGISNDVRIAEVCGADCEACTGTSPGTSLTLPRGEFRLRLETQVWPEETGGEADLRITLAPAS